MTTESIEVSMEKTTTKTIATTTKIPLPIKMRGGSVGSVYSRNNYGGGNMNDFQVNPVTISKG